ncbi:MAG: type II toxin-antitoxin system RelE/ParE family toxin [Elusimicrobia bacterium]|nr:type II toxin-antitoxin system RelE/ParE family toxin [Elusimicrobiota bacterium]
MSFSLRFHEKPDGECQVKDYIRSRSKKVRGKAGWLLSRLENEGNKLERPLVGFLKDGIYELRVIVEREQYRILCFFNKEVIVVTNAFLKKGRKVPPDEIERAKAARTDWLEREEK